MENRNTLAAVYAARCKAGNPNAGSTAREEPRAEEKRRAPAAPAARGALDEAVLLDVLRRSAGPCDRIFASRLAFSLGAEGGL
jgi:hypothetical protein